MSSLAKGLKILVGTAALACASMSFAGERVDWSISVGSGGYYYPQPARVYTPPPAVVYTPPPVVYYPPVTPVVEYQTYYYGQPRWQVREEYWRHHHRHHHDFRD